MIDLYKDKTNIVVFTWINISQFRQNSKCNLKNNHKFVYRSQSGCVHEQVAKADCECPLYKYLAWNCNKKCFRTEILYKFVKKMKKMVLQQREKF